MNAMSQLECGGRGSSNRRRSDLPAAQAWSLGYGVMSTSTNVVVDRFVDHANAVAAKLRLEARTRETYVVRKCG